MTNGTIKQSFGMSTFLGMVLKSWTNYQQLPLNVLIFFIEINENTLSTMKNLMYTTQSDDI